MMNEKLTNYVDGIFAPYDEIKSVADLKADLLNDLDERYRELRAEGMDEESAIIMTIDGIGDIEQTVQEVADLSHALERKVFTNFSASNLPKSDFSGVVAHKGKFNASALRESNFATADLSGSTFQSSDVRDANFDKTNLTDCVMSTSDLSGCSFDKSILVRTDFTSSGLSGARFRDVKFVDCKLNTTDLRKSIFESCIFNGVTFRYSDLRGLNFDGQTFVGVTFDKSALNDMTFRGATLKNVSFVSMYSISNKYYKAIGTIQFDGAIMDKLTYAALKGANANLDNVTII
jgi:uncharacterized protein YjbI with pentapeptide repeats